MSPTGVYRRNDPATVRARLAKLAEAQRQPLQAKVAAALHVIEQLPRPLVVMFSGGRDSATIAHLAAAVDPQTRLLYCDTGLAAPHAAARVEAVAASLSLPLIVSRPTVTAEDLWRTRGHYPIGPKRGHTYLKAARPGLRSSPVQCCYWLKERPAKAALRNIAAGSLLWGNRADDSNRRKLGVADYGLVQPPSNRWPCTSAQPIAFWLDADVAAYLRQHMPDGRWESRAETGCQCCCTDLARRDNNLSRLFLRDRQAFDAAIRTGLGEQILLARDHPRPYDVDALLATAPEVFLRIPKVGKAAAYKGTAP